MQSLVSYVRGVMHPEAFHGQGRNRNFFEGWYLKLVSADGKQRWAVIPGIFRGPDSEAIAFVQVLDGQTGRSWFHQFPATEFEAAANRFEVRVGDNHFDTDGIRLNLPQLKGQLQFSTALDPWPVTLREPGIMGWYGLVPFMECFHGVVSFGHALAGTLDVEGQPASFDSGRGYIEKDWGRAFPAGYIWMQSNHFAANADASFVGSVAIIPWLTGSFRGYIIGLKHSGKLHKWATYNGSTETKLEVDDKFIHWNLVGPDGSLEVKAERKAGGLLHAPLRTAMYQRVEETMLATINLIHRDSRGNVIFEDQGLCAGMEIFGDLERLLKSN